jgi:GT2 family glycosyltransferase
VSEDGLDIGIVAYRSRRLLRDCLASLHEHAPARPMHVVLVDNDSRDGTVEMVREFPAVELIEAGRNLGFAAATNVALARGTGRYFLALNPDTRLQAGVLDRLLGLMDEQPEVGICGCRLEREDGSFDHAAKRAFPTPLGALAHFTRIGRSNGAPAALAQYRAPHVERGPVDAVSGAFMLLRRSALDEVGRFDEGYWLYMEDLDWCHRFWDAGWKVFYEPAGVALHVKGGSSAGRRAPRQEIAFHRGMGRFYRRFDAPEHNPLLNAAVYAGIGAKLLTSLAIGAAHGREKA